MLAPPLKLLGGPGPPWPPLFLRLCLDPYLHNRWKFGSVVHHMETMCRTYTLTLWDKVKVSASGQSYICNTLYSNLEHL